MGDITRQDDEAGVFEMNEQRLAARSVPWRRDQSDTPVAEYVSITFDELKLLRRAQQLTCQCHQLIHVVVWTIGGIDPAVLGLLHENRGVGKQADVPNVVSVRVRYRHKSDIGRLQSEVGELLCQRPVEVVDDQSR